jgi:cyclophilin family peptidyl-prolyl cis-trans isomerase
MKTQWWTIWGLALALVACSPGGDGADRAQANRKAQEKSTAPAKPKYPRLDNGNVVAELTAYGQANPETVVLISTRLGDIKIRLYDDVPLHRANFIRLVKMGYYEKTEFFRVIRGFIVQGGGTQSLGMDIGNYTIPAEMSPKYLHVRGAVAMAREYEKNPDKRSASHDFYIVQGTRIAPGELDAFAAQQQVKVRPEQRKAYAQTPGAPHLDREHTVFGQVVEGLDVVDKIADLKTDKGNWPLESVMLSAKVLR